MKMLGAKVVPATSGSKTLKDLQMRQFVIGFKTQKRFI
jgi:tryptophan synthase beta subunit